MDMVTRCPCCRHAPAGPAAECPVCGCPLAPGFTVEGRLLRNGDFRLLRRLDDGGSARLYLAEAIPDGGLRVVKAFQPPAEWKSRALFEARFHEEAQLLSRLSREHPAIPDYYDSFIDSGGFYIVLEFVPGRNLEYYMRDHVGRLPVEEVLDYIRQVVDVLAVIHSLPPAPVIHGDIKPSNLIRRPEGRVAVIDFGLARQDMPMPPYVPAQASAFGTPGYTPLEQWEGHPTPASDIFALGATMHHLLTGRSPAAPFTRLAEVSYADISILTTFPPLTALVPEAPPLLERLVADMLRRRPAERPTAAELKARLLRLDALGIS
jgi:serine/threonine-protein kinase